VFVVYDHNPNDAVSGRDGQDSAFAKFDSLGDWLGQFLPGFVWRDDLSLSILHGLVKEGLLPDKRERYSLHHEVEIGEMDLLLLEVGQEIIELIVSLFIYFPILMRLHRIVRANPFFAGQTRMLLIFQEQ